MSAKPAYVNKTPEQRLKYFSNMPAKKRIYSYDTLKSFHFAIIQRIAAEWWGLEVEGKAKIALLEEIENAQEIASVH